MDPAGSRDVCRGLRHCNHYSDESRDDPDQFALPYAVTGLTGYSFGTTTFFINLIFIALQWVILSRKGVFHYHDVLSDSGRVVFSAFIDFTMSLSGGIMPESYPLRLLISFAGTRFSRLVS